MDKSVIKAILVSQHEDVERFPVRIRQLYQVADSLSHVFVGVRRAGKSFVMYQLIQHMLSNGTGWNDILFVDFEDNRLEQFSSMDFNLLLECHIELYGIQPKYIFMDEVQNISGWDRFARHMADTKHIVYISGSNADMLSREFMLHLGGRYLEDDVYPYSFVEYLDALGVAYTKEKIYGTTSASLIRKAFAEYMQNGGLPETVNLPVKRSYISSTYQKIYLADIVARNKINHLSALKLMIKKMAESVRQPISYNRLANILSTLGEKLSTATIVGYVNYCEDAWLLLRLRNIASSLSEKERVCKYYFVDNGVLNLFLLNGETALLENMVALQLFRMFGHDRDNDTVYYYHNHDMEVDFYIPEQKWAIQVCYSMQDPSTQTREVSALTKLPQILECNRRTILTMDEERVIADSMGEIEVVPVWKWIVERVTINDRRQSCV